MNNPDLSKSPLEHIAIQNKKIDDLQALLTASDLERGVLRSCLELAKQYPQPTSPTSSVNAVMKSPAQSLRDMADYEEAKERAWAKIDSVLSSPSSTSLEGLGEVKEALRILSGDKHNAIYSDRIKNALEILGRYV